MDEREQQATEQDERGYEPPVAEDVDTEVIPAVTAAGMQSQM